MSAGGLPVLNTDIFLLQSLMHLKDVNYIVHCEVMFCILGSCRPGEKGQEETGGAEE